MEEWDQWARSCPTTLANVSPEQRTHLEMPTAYQPVDDGVASGHHKVREIISYVNPKGGRVDAKKLKADHVANRRILVSKGDTVAVKRPKPCSALSRLSTHASHHDGCSCPLLWWTRTFVLINSVSAF